PPGSHPRPRPCARGQGASRAGRQPPLDSEAMCGICGIVQLGGEPRPLLDDAALCAMTDTMTHRGPSDRGTYLEDGIALGVRRLSIVDVEGGHQPVSSEDGAIWAIQNGELYNHLALRESLQGHRFASRCDTEI